MCHIHVCFCIVLVVFFGLQIDVASCPGATARSYDTAETYSWHLGDI